MSATSWGQSIARIDAAGTQYNTYTTAKSMLTSATATAASAGTVILPPNFWQVGGILDISIVAGISNIVTTQTTWTMEVRLGPTANIVAFTTGAINTTTTAHVNIPAFIRILLTCRTIGSGTLATLMGQGMVQGQMIAGAAALTDGVANTGNIMAPNTAPAVGTGFDSTIANVLDIFVAQSLSGASNGFQMQQYNVVSYGNSSL